MLQNRSGRVLRLSLKLMAAFLQLLSFLSLESTPMSLAAGSPEHRGVWIQNDSNLSAKLDKLKQAHFNVLYYGIWGARNLGLQQVIDLAHAKGFDIHLWEANSYICAGQWLSGCTNDTDHPEWFARFPNGMSRGELLDTSDWFDFGVPAAKEYSINVMADYLNQYNAEGVHFDYIRYDGNYRGNNSFSDANLSQFEARYGIDAALVRGDTFPVFAVMHGNRVKTPTTAKVLAEFHDGVPALLLNDYKNGQVLLFNWKAFYIYTKVPDDVLKRAIQQFGSSQIYVAKADVNSGEYGPFFATTNWLRHLGYASTQTTLADVAQLPAGSLLVVPGIYLLSVEEINNLDGHLSRGGDIIFLDPPVTTVSRNVSQTFKDILGVDSTATYLGGKALITVPAGARDDPLLVGLVGSHEVTYAQAQEYIDRWNEYMQGTVTDVVRGVRERARLIKPEAKISAAVFSFEKGNALSVYQNWPLWVRNDYLDYALTMVYTLNMTTFTNHLDWLQQNGMAERTIPGLGVHNFTSCSDKTTILQEIDLLRSRGFAGFNIFDSIYMTDAGRIAADCNLLGDLQTVLGEDVEPYYPSASPVATPTPKPRPMTDVKGSEHLPVIDGRPSEFDGASALQFTDDSGRGERNNTTTARLLWDSTHLYLLIEVADSQLNASATQRDGETWNDDAVEVFIDPLNNGGISFGTDDYRMALNVNGALSDAKGDFGGWAWNGNAEYRALAQGTINDNADVDTGYTVEIALPWTDLGISPTAGLTLGIDIAVDDRDLPEDGYQYSDWAGLADFNDPQSWGQAVLAAELVPGLIFADVPSTHPYHDEIDALYGAGYTAGCATDPLRYCPDATMNRAESAVFVERGIHAATYDPPAPTSQVFADLPLDSWAAKWVNGLWQDQYTAGCGTNPLVYCPWQGHTRAEGCVFYLRMLRGANYEPPQPSQQMFTDVPLEAWYAKWVQAAYDAALLTPCQTSPELQFCPEGPLTRALAAYMMVQAKGLLGP